MRFYKVNDTTEPASKAITSCLNASLYSRQAGTQAGRKAHPGVCNSVQAPPSVSNQREGEKQMIR